MSSNEQNNPNRISGALTFPSRSEGNAQAVPVQPRQPTNLQGLLRFAMEATKAEDASANAAYCVMNEERRKFLEGALKSLTVDMTQVINESIHTLADGLKMKSIRVEDSLPEDVKFAFDNLLELVDDIDIANDFYRLGGFAIFPQCYSSENEKVRAKASTILGDCCQNNPFCQEKAVETGMLDVLIGLMQSERGEALVKCLYAVSCCCREYPPACRILVSRGGCATLVSLLTAPEPAARTKAAFLIRYLCHNDDEARETILCENLLPIISNQIKNGRDTTTEHLLSIILAVLENKDQNVIKECHDIGLKIVLQEHLKHPDLVSDQFREEKEYCESILKILEEARASESVDFEVDR